MESLKKRLKSHGSLLLLLIPAIVFALIFSYIPMSGLIMAFKSDIDLTAYHSPVAAILMAEWAGMGGFEQFVSLFTESSGFLTALANTLIISTLKIVLVFPIPVFLAICVTEIKNKTGSKVVQSIMYLPHFLSWAVVAAVFMTFMHTKTGGLNTMLGAIGIPPMNVSDPKQFPWIMVLTTGWKDIGWSAVTYIAAIMAIDTEQYEAAKIDGAGRLKQVFYITLPGMAATIAMLLIMRIGYLMDAGFEQIYAMLTPSAESTGDIIGTFIYRLSIKQGGNFALATAAGLFNSIIALVLILGGNLFSKKVFNRSMW